MGSPPHGLMLRQEFLKVPFSDHCYFQHILTIYQILSNTLSSKTKIFADDISLFSVIQDSAITTSELNSDLATKKQWDSSGR